MSSIDNRIVILTFDNKDFENNVQTSLGTLDKLKKGLDLEDSANGLSAISASAKTVNLSPIGEAVESIKDRFSTLGIIGATVIQNLTNSAVNAAKNIFSKIASGGINRALNFEQANFQLEGLLGNLEGGAEKIESIMNAANNAVSGTAYGLDEAAKVASQLVASGIQDGERMEFILKGVAGTAAMTGSSYTEMGDIFTTVAGNGKLMTEQLRQFSHRGLNVAATLADQLHVTEAEVREMVTAGEIDFETFANAMSNAFGEHAQAANKTFTGSLSNVKAALSRLGAKVAMPSLENLRDIFNVLRPLIDTVSAALDPFISKLNTGLHKASMSAVSALTTLYLGFGGDAQKLKEQTEYASEDAQKAIDAAIQRYEKAGNLFKNIGEFLSKIGQVIKEAFSETFSGLFTKNVDGASASLAAFSEKLKLSDNAAEGLKTVLKLLLTPFKLLIEVASKVISVFAQIISFIAKLVNSFLEFIGSLSKTNSAMDETSRKAKLLEAIHTVVSKLGEIFVAFKNKVVECAEAIKNSEGFQKLSDALSKLWEVIKQVAGEVLDKFIEKLNSFGNYNPDFSWLDTFVDLLSKGATKLAEFIEALINGENPIKNFFSNLGDGEGPLAKFIGFLSTIKDKIVDFFKNFTFDSDGEGFFSSITNFFSGGIAKIKDSNFISQIVDFFKTVAEKLKEVDWKNVLSQVKDIAQVVLAFAWIKSLIDLNKSASGVLDNISSALESFTLKDAFKRDWSQKMQSFAIGVGILVGALWVISKIPNEELKTSAVTLGIIVGALAVVYELIEHVPMGTGAFQKFSAGIIGLGAGLLMLVGSIKLLSMMNPEDFKKGATAVFEVVMILALAARLAGVSSFGTLVGMALAVDMLVPALLILGHTKWNTIQKGVRAIGEIVMILAVAARLAGVSSFGTLVGMALSVDLLVPALLIIGKTEWSVIQKGIKAISEIVLVLAVASRIAGSTSFGSMLGMAVTVGAVAVSLKVLSDVEFDSLLSAAIALSGTLIALAAALKIADSINGAGGVIALIAVLTGLTIAFKVLSDIPVETSLGITTSLSITCLALAASLKIVSDMSLKDALVSVLALSGVLTALVVAFKVMAEIPSEQTLAIAESLSITAIALSAALWIISKIPVAAAAQGIVGFDLFVADLTAILVALGALDKIPGFSDLVSAGAGVFGKLGEGLGNFVGGIIGGIGEGITSTLPDIADNLTSFSEKIEPFISNMGKLSPSLVDSTKNLAEAVLVMCGASMLDSISTFLNFGESPFEKIGKGLAEFAPYMRDYAEQISGVNPEAVEASAKAALMIAEFADTIPNEGGFLADIVGDNTLAQFAEGLVPFGEALADYSEAIAGKIDEEAVATSTRAGMMITEFAGTIPNEGGWAAQVLGDNTLAQFAEGLVPFAEALVEYSTTVSSGGIDEEAVATSTRAATLITEFAHTIPNEGGWAAQVLGDNTLAQFAEGLVPFAEALVEYSRTVKGNIDEEAVATSTRAATLITEFANTIQNSGGILAALVGDNSLTLFAQELEAFAPSLVSYSNTVKGNIDEEAVATSTRAATLLVDFYNKVKDVVGSGLDMIWSGSPLYNFSLELEKFGPSISAYSRSVSDLDESAVSKSAAAGEILADFYGKVKDVISGGLKGLWEGSPLVNLGQQLDEFGPYLASYSESISSVSTGKISSINDAMVDVLDMTDAVNSAEYNQIDNYSKALKDFGSKLNDYNSKVSSVNTGKVSQVVATVYELIAVANEMAVVDASAMGNFGNELENCGKVGVEGFISAFENSLSDAYSAGSDLVENAANGAESASDYGSWYQIGQYAAQGLINGLDSMYYSVYNTAYSIGSAAVQGASNALAVMSPSREMFKIGDYAGQGLVNGMVSMESRIFSTGHNLGDQVLDSISRPLSKIQDLINSDVDQEPVITPILDLSSVNAGIGSLNGMLGNRQVSVQGSYGLSAISNLNSIRELAARMDASTLGDNSDVVEAISEMRQDIIGLGDSITKMQIRLDGKALVGSIIDPIDDALGMRAEYAGRGIY